MVAYGRGGALETVIPQETGMFFHEKSVESLNLAIREFEKNEDQFDPKKIVENAKRFSKQNFLTTFEKFICDCLEEHSSEFTLPLTVSNSQNTLIYYDFCVI